MAWVIDTDCGFDDAFAIMLMLKHANVVAITTQAGNTSLENVNDNVNDYVNDQVNDHVSLRLSTCFVERPCKAKGIERLIFPSSKKEYEI